MSGAKLERIAGLLEEVQQKVLRHASWARGTGTLPDDAAHQTDGREIAELRLKLARATSALKQELSNFNFAQQIALRAPRNERWRTSKPLQHREKDLKTVYKMAADTLTAIEDLESRNAKVSLPDLIASITSMQLDKLQEAQELTITLQQHRAHLPSFRQDTPTVQNVPLSLMLVMIIGYLAMWAQRGKDR